MFDVGVLDVDKNVEYWCWIKDKVGRPAQDDKQAIEPQNLQDEAEPKSPTLKSGKEAMSHAPYLP